MTKDSKDIKKVAVLGLGYVGFPLACLIAKKTDYEVVGFDLSEEKVSQIKNGISPVEDDLAEELLPQIDMEVSTSEEILKDSDIYIIAVPTPIDSEYNPNLKPVIGASKIVARYLKKGDSVIIESTINPGVCEEVVLPVLEKESGMKGGGDFELAHCPERINPGDKVWNVSNISRNIGALTAKGTKKLANFYREFVDAQINEMNTIKEAEATKIVENTFRDINIAYVNELAKSFDKMGIDLMSVLKGSSNKPFAFMPHFPSCGVGGHCIPVDPYYLIERAKKAGFDHRFLRIAREVNNSMPRYTVEKLVIGLNKIGKSVKDTKVGILGLSFKANIGDLRESPSLRVIDILEKEYDAILNIYDPFAKKESTHKDLESFLKDSDAVILATNHKDFVDADPKLWKNIEVLIDGKNCLDKEKIKAQGVLYFGIGQN